MTGLGFSDVIRAHERIRNNINRTPVMTSATLDASSGAQLFFKCENLQKSGAFKARGATNAVLSLSEDHAARGVVTHSSGNHAGALARAAGLRSIPAYIVMPHNSSKAKQESVRRYGGQIFFCEPTLEAREATAADITSKTGATFVHPYNDLRVMAGQGTTAIEFLADVPDLDVILVPVGGGGHISGIAVAAKHTRPDVRVVGVEPEGADDAQRSLRGGRLVGMPHPRTIADGLRTALGDKTFAEIQRHVDDIVAVSDESIVDAMRTIWEVMKLVVEPSGAVAYAAIDAVSVSIRNLKAGIVLTGGNLDLDELPWQSPQSDWTSLASAAGRARKDAFDS